MRFRKLDMIDPICFKLLTKWSEQHENTGGKVVSNWGSLTEKYECQ